MDLARHDLEGDVAQYGDAVVGLPDSVEPDCWCAGEYRGAVHSCFLSCLRSSDLGCLAGRDAPPGGRVSRRRSTRSPRGFRRCRCPCPGPGRPR
ncbi:hypothetical protein ACFPRL_09480 [Pseudoclavibacter helvolus]